PGDPRLDHAPRRARPRRGGKSSDGPRRGRLTGAGARPRAHVRPPQLARRARRDRNNELGLDDTALGVAVAAGLTGRVFLDGVLASAAQNHRSWFGRGRDAVECEGVTAFV